MDQRAEAAKTTERSRVYRHDSAAEEIAGLELGGLGRRTEVDVGSKLLGSRDHLNHKPIASADSRQDADGRTPARASAHRCRGELRAIRRLTGTPLALTDARDRSGGARPCYAWGRDLGGGDPGAVVRPERLSDPIGILADFGSWMSCWASATAINAGQASGAAHSARSPWPGESGAVVGRSATIISAWLSMLRCIKVALLTIPTPMTARRQTKTTTGRSQRTVLRQKRCWTERRLKLLLQD